MRSILREFIWILDESAIYLILGFALAGLLHVLLSRYQKVTEKLRGPGVRPVILASVLGLPLPLCSCSVLPAALTLRRQGASKGTTSSFLVSVPETDIVSILLTYGLMGPVLAIFRPFAALVTAVVTGVVVNLVDSFRSPGEGGAVSSPGESAATAHTPHQDPASGEGSHKAAPRPSILERIYHYGFVEFFDDLAAQLLVGLLLAAAVSAWLPSFDLIGRAQGSPWMYLVMLVVGIPMYVCATASTPIAAGLILAGVSPGAALVFLLAGPATNLASLTVLARQFGRLALGAYLVSVSVLSVFMGLWLDATLKAGGIAVQVSSAAALGAGGPLRVAGMVLFLLLALVSFRRTRAPERWVRQLNTRFGLSLRPRPAMATALLLLAVLYLTGGFFTVRPGERGIVTRFGAITGAWLKPGLHYHWPAPLGNYRVELVDELKRIDLGFRREEPVPAGRTAENAWIDEAWLLTGDENIIDIQCSVYYQLVDSREALLDYVYGVGDKEALVRAAAERALRSVIGSVDIETLLTTRRDEVERRVRDEELQPALQRCNAGLRVVDVKLLSVHAPPQVHQAFRDVASAVEDKAQKVNLAYEHRERLVREARGEADTVLANAHGTATQAVETARGAASRFEARRLAYEEAPQLTRSWMYLEELEKVLPGLRKYVDLTSESGTRPEFWLQKGSGAVRPPMMPPAPTAATQSGEEDR
jgi:HflK protein